MSDYEVSKSTQSTIFRDTLYFTCDLWQTKIDSKSLLWLNIKESLICEYFSLLVQNLLRQIQNKRFFCFKVHSSYHPRIYSACLVFQTQPAEQPALSWQRQSTPKFTQIYRIWNLFHICKICILNFSFSSRISRK